MAAVFFCVKTAMVTVVCMSETAMRAVFLTLTAAAPQKKEGGGGKKGKKKKRKGVLHCQAENNDARRAPAARQNQRQAALSRTSEPSCVEQS